MKNIKTQLRKKHFLKMKHLVDGILVQRSKITNKQLP